MDKEILEKVAIEAVKYYFNGLSAKEAIDKALEEKGGNENNMELTCVYKERWNREINEKKVKHCCISTIDNGCNFDCWKTHYKRTGYIYQ